jgi:hypothetical protein
MTTDIEDMQQIHKTQRLALFQLCRFLFPRPLVPVSVPMAGHLLAESCVGILIVGEGLALSQGMLDDE